MLYQTKKKRNGKCPNPLEYFLSEGNKLLKDDFNLKHTYYASPHGLSNAMNKTTCYDMSIITLNALKDKMYQDIIS